MTSSTNELSPELRDLLGDLSEQRESVLLNVTRADLTKIVERPGGEGVDRTVGRLSSAEKELLDCRRFELAGAIHAKVIWSAVEAPDLWTGGYVGSVVREQMTPLRVALNELTITRDDVEIGSTLAGIASDAPLDPVAASRAQSLAVRLVPTSSHRILLGHALWQSGKRDAAARLARVLALEASSAPAQTYIFDLVAMIASSRFRAHEAAIAYRYASRLDPSRPAPALEWFIQAIYCGDESSSGAAVEAVLGTPLDEGVVGPILALRRQARGDGRWSPDKKSRSIAARLVDHNDPRIAGAAHVFS